MILIFFSICSLTLFLCLFQSNCPFFSSCSFHFPWEICFIYSLCFQLLYVFRCCLSSLLFFYGVYMLAHTFVCAYTHVCVGHRITSGVPQELSHHVFKSLFLNSLELAHLARLTASPRDLPVSTFPVLGLWVHAIILIFLSTSIDWAISQLALLLSWTQHAQLFPGLFYFICLWSQV